MFQDHELDKSSHKTTVAMEEAHIARRFNATVEGFSAEMSLKEENHQGVEPSPGRDNEALEVAKECLAEVFQIDMAALCNQSNCDSLIDIFNSQETSLPCDIDGVNVSNAPSVSRGQTVVRNTRKLHSHGKDALFGQFLDSLEKIHYFKRMPDGSDDQVQLDRIAHIFHDTVEEMKISGYQSFDRVSLAENFKLQGNKSMQSKLYYESIELYTFSIALCEDNAVYYCNRAAAYTQIKCYVEAVQDCLKSLHINPHYSKAYSRLGFAYYAQGKYRDAIDKGFMKALQLDPTNDSLKENIRVAEQKLKEEQERPDQNSTSTCHGESSQPSESGSRNPAATPPPFPSMPFSVGGLSSNIASMLGNMVANANPGQIFENRVESESLSGAQNVLENVPEELSGALRTVMGMFTQASPQGNQQDDVHGRSCTS